MENICPFKPGSYIIDESYIIPSEAPEIATEITDSVLDVELDPRNKTIVNGHGFAHNVSIVKLLEDYHEFDIIINMGEGFCFYLKKPIIHGGKVFSPGVKSIIRFTPTTPFIPISDEEFSKMKKRLRFI